MANNAGVVEVRKDARLPYEAGLIVVAAAMLNLRRDDRSLVGISSPVDYAHPPRTGDVLDHEPLADDISRAHSPSVSLRQTCGSTARLPRTGAKRSVMYDDLAWMCASPSGRLDASTRAG